MTIKDHEGLFKEYKTLNNFGRNSLRIPLLSAKSRPAPSTSFYFRVFQLFRSVKKIIRTYARLTQYGKKYNVHTSVIPEGE